MKKLIVLVVSIVMGVSTIACNDASANNNVAMSYSKLNGSGWTIGAVRNNDLEVRATLQSAMAANGFVNSQKSAVIYEAKATWSSDNKFVTICVTSEDYRTFDKSESLLPGGCISTSSDETGVDGAIGIALLPKAAEKMALMLKHQIDGKAMPTQISEPQPAPAKQPATKPESPPANTAANTKK